MLATEGKAEEQELWRRLQDGIEQWTTKSVYRVNEDNCDVRSIEYHGIYWSRESLLGHRHDYARMRHIVTDVEGDAVGTQ
jgi:hypothetical protein